MDRLTWRSLIRNGARSFESKKDDKAKKKRARMKCKEAELRAADHPLTGIRAAKANVSLICRAHSVDI